MVRRPAGGRTLLVTGGTGRLGRAVAKQAAASGYRVRILSRRGGRGLAIDGEWVRGDLMSGAGLDDAVRDVDIVLHAATDPTGDPWATDVEGTERLLLAARQAAVGHLIYPSIVGVDRIPFPYYRAKAEAERRIATSGVAHTTVRITQFHSFIDMLLGRFARLPLLPLPTGVQIQSIAVEEAAAALLGYAEGPPAGRAPDTGGPEILRLGDMARSWIRARGLRRWVTWTPYPGGLIRAFRKGLGVAPEGRVGTERWADWLQRPAAAE